MESEASDSSVPGVFSRLLPIVGPLFLISVGYIDPGKWATLIEAGSRFGFDFVLLVLIFNCAAILCQSLAARIGVVTGKNLAQICGEEYAPTICTLLGIQIELSAIISDLTMILGIAHGLNLLLGLDLLICVSLTVIDGALILLILDSQSSEIRKFEAMSVLAAGFVLLYYVLMFLVNQPEVSFVMNVLPRVRGESLYTVLALLGASILPHNFYIHSSIIQKQQKKLNVSTGTVCHDHFFATTLIFSAMFLVNYMIMSLAVSTFHSAGLAVLTFQDALLLLDQVLKSSIASFILFVALLIASFVTSLTCTVGLHASLHGFLGAEMPLWLHRLMTKMVALVPAIYCVYKYGAEGIYQLLVLSQVVLAMQLPSSVIPLFRIASSSSIMGSSKIPASVEILSQAAFFGMLAVNILFVTEMLFGDSEWVGTLSVGGSVMLPFVFVLVTACASLFFMLWLAVTPLKSASEKPDSRALDWETQNSLLGLSMDKEDISLERDLEPRSDHQAAPIVPDDSAPEHESFTEDIYDSNEYHPFEIEKDQLSSLGDSESASVSGLSPVMAADKVPRGGSPDAASILETSLDAPPATMKVEVGIETRKDEDEGGAWLPENLSAEALESSSLVANEGPGSFRSVTGKIDDTGSGNASLTRLSGLGRAARKQLASVLDEFWGQLYDFHGQITTDAKSKRIDVILGLKPPSANLESPGLEERSLLSSSIDYESFLPQRKVGSVESSYGMQGSPSLPSSLQSLDAYTHGPNRSSTEISERRYSSLRLPPYSDSRHYQPATIHGYQLSSYLSRMATNPMESPGLGPSSFTSNYIDAYGYGSARNSFGSVHALNLPSQTFSNTLPTDARYIESTVTSTEETMPSAYSKKYHSLPDISVLGIPRRGPSSMEKSSQRMGTIGPGQSIISQDRLRTESVPLAFDELSPSKLHKDAFSLQTKSSMETNSLWSRQPFEQLFGTPQGNIGSSNGMESWIRPSSQRVSHAEAEAELLKAFRFCIMKLLKLEGSEWLFQQSGGSDEELIDLVAARERFLQDVESKTLSHSTHAGESLYFAADRKFASGPRDDDGRLSKMLVPTIPHCGDGCIWRVSLIVSFGVWCIHRILDLALVESRPELWGKYTYVLNRLQGVLDPAFSQPRVTRSPCFCLQTPASFRWPGSIVSNGLPSVSGRGMLGRCTTASTLLEIIKDVETAVASRKGRTGTAAGDVAFPKGKENLASVLKRYKRRLSNKSIGVNTGGSGPGKASLPSPGPSLFVS
ncbi:Ethylene-insensitive protein 2 [Nymphaea thermarum]|nr:Ethylene-insensitive protein 2 [Nymphaea thermarum]